jgi:hypothetical protein
MAPVARVARVSPDVEATALLRARVCACLRALSPDAPVAPDVKATELLRAHVCGYVLARVQAAARGRARAAARAC